MSKVYLTSTKENKEDDLIGAVRTCFDQYGGVDHIVKGKIFIKINATAVNIDAITTPEVIVAIIKVIREAKIKSQNIFIFDNSAFGFPTRVL